MSALQDKGLDEAFWPIFQFDEPDKDKNAWVQRGLRLLFGLALASMSFALYHHAPDKGGRFAQPGLLCTLNLVP